MFWQQTFFVLPIQELPFSLNAAEERRKLFLKTQIKTSKGQKLQKKDQNTSFLNPIFILDSQLKEKKILFEIQNFKMNHK